MSYDVRINTNPLSVDIINKEEIMKSKDISVDEMRNYMYEMCGDNDLMLEALRLTAKKMKPISYRFKDIK